LKDTFEGVQELSVTRTAAQVLLRSQLRVKSLFVMTIHYGWLHLPRRRRWHRWWHHQPSSRSFGKVEACSWQCAEFWGSKGRLFWLSGLL